MRTDLDTMGVANPYTLAELAIGRRIDWSRIVDPKAVIETALGMPWDQLINPASGSILYAGLVPSTGGDPVQGGLGDCYFISALDAVAWFVDSTPLVLISGEIPHACAAFVVPLRSASPTLIEIKVVFITSSLRPPEPLWVNSV